MTVPSPDPTDVHAGATPDQLCSALAQVVATLAQSCADLGLRPSGLGAGALFGELDMSVVLPGADIPGVDALADRYDLPREDLPAGPPPFLYARSGHALAGDRDVTLTVSTARPGATPPPLEAVAAAPGPVAVTGERPPVTLPALPTLAELMQVTA